MACNKSLSLLRLKLVGSPTRSNPQHFKKSPKLQYFIRFRAVCKSWRLVVPYSEAHQLSWILENPIGQLGKIRFYSLSSAQIYESFVPESNHKKFFGPGHGHFLYFSARTRLLSMHDPISNEFTSSPLLHKPKPGLVLQFYDQSTPGAYHFSFYRLDYGHWIEASTIGDQTLFLSKRRGLSMCANDFQGYEGDCIYFFDKLFSKFQLFRYHIMDGTTEVVPCSFERGSAWFVPVLDPIELPQN